LFFWIVVIAFVSILLAVVSLKRENAKKELVKVKEELSKGKVIFQSSSESSESSS
jgi:hypothetical protein